MGLPKTYGVISWNTDVCTPKENMEALKVFWQGRMWYILFDSGWWHLDHRFSYATYLPTFLTHISGWEHEGTKFCLILKIM